MILIQRNVQFLKLRLSIKIITITKEISEKDSIK